MRPVQPSVAAQFELVGSGTVGASVRGRHGHNTHGHNTKRRALLLDDSQWAEPSVHAGLENGFPVGRERTEQNLALQTDQPRRTSQENSAPESMSAVPPTVSRAADCDGAADTKPSDEESVLEQQQEQLERDLIELKRKKAKEFPTILIHQKISKLYMSLFQTYLSLSKSGTKLMIMFTTFSYKKMMGIISAITFGNPQKVRLRCHSTKLITSLPLVKTINNLMSLLPNGLRHTME